MTSPDGHDAGSRLPALGARGGGWVAAQLLLLATIALSPLADGSSVGHPVARGAGGGGVLALGVALLVWASARLGPSLTPFPAPRADRPVQTSGPYTLVRHPMYSAVILIALGWSIVFATVPGLALTAVLVLFLDLKSRREEAWLGERLQGYSGYRLQTPRRFVPFVY